MFLLIFPFLILREFLVHLEWEDPQGNKDIRYFLWIEITNVWLSDFVVSQSTLISTAKKTLCNFLGKKFVEI